MSGDLAVWLTAQLDEIEQVARAAVDLGRSQWTWTLLATKPNVTLLAIGDPGTGLQPIDILRDDRVDAATAAHIALHDPAFVLAWVARDRRIMQRALDLIASFGDWDADEAKANGGRVLWSDVNRRERSHAHDTLRDLAEPFRDWPGFREEWRT